MVPACPLYRGFTETCSGACRHAWELYGYKGTVYNSEIVNLFLQVSVDECTEGIVRVAQQTRGLDPRQQGTFEWEISAGINTDLDHNCTGKDALKLLLYSVLNNTWVIPELSTWIPSIIVVLYDQDGGILDTKPIHFKTLDNCIYCSDGQCNCSVSVCFNFL